MHGGKQTLYEVLGIPDDARAADITRAYRNLRAEMAKETAPPDPRRAALVSEAYGILSDPGRRAQYDASLKERFVLGVRAFAPRRARRVAAAAALVLLAGAVGYLALAPGRGAPGKSLQEIGEMAALSVGRLHRIDLSGQTTSLGVAFAIEEGVLVTSCEGLVPGAQYFVSLPPRKVPASVSSADERRGLCRLSASGMGSWPLALSSVEPKPGERVYVVNVNPAGQAYVKEGSVKRVTASAAGDRVIETAGAATADGGAPLLDSFGRVVAVAAPAKEGGVRHVAVPAAWLAEARPAASAPPASRAGAQPPSEASKSPLERQPVEMPAHRREALEKSFRPPPSVPDDL